MKFLLAIDIQQIWLGLRDYKVFFILALVIFSLKEVVIYIYRKRKPIGPKKDNFVLGVNNVSWLLYTILAFFLVLHAFNITITEFLSSITIIAAALAVVFKDYILHGLNGMILMFGENVQMGDTIEIAGHKGKVVNMTLLNVHLINDEEDLIIIPNNTVMNQDMINLSRNPKQNSTLDFEVKSSHLLSVEELETKLMNRIAIEMDLLREESVKLRVVDFEKDIIHYRFRFGLKIYDLKTESRIKQMLWKEIVSLLRANQSADSEMD